VGACAAIVPVDRLQQMTGWLPVTRAKRMYIEPGRRRDVITSRDQPEAASNVVMTHARRRRQTDLLTVLHRLCNEDSIYIHSFQLTSI